MLKQIQAPIESEFKQFNEWFDTQIKQDSSYMRTILSYVYKSKGKQIRPLITLLAAKLVSPNVSDATFAAATMIEMIHGASLVHDDVVDQAFQRRGFFSVNAVWGAKTSILSGDYLFTKGLVHGLQWNSQEVIQVAAETILQMSEGEIIQMENARRMCLTEVGYFDVIDKKTACLLANCAKIGGASVQATQEQKLALHQYGRHLGIAFQLKDDILDYESTEQGKPIGNDLQERKLTLPLLYSLERTTFFQRMFRRAQIRQCESRPELIPPIQHWVVTSGGVEYTRQKIREHGLLAEQALNIFADSAAKQSLLMLIDYLADRKI